VQFQFDETSFWISYEADTCFIWIIKYYVKKAEKGLDLSNVTAVCVDETSEKKGHKYITVFADPNSRRVIYVCKCKGATQ